MVVVANRMRSPMFGSLDGTAGLVSAFAVDELRIMAPNMPSEALLQVAEFLRPLKCL
jgi:hypothetical protein